MHTEHMGLPAAAPDKGRPEGEAGRQGRARSLINGRFRAAMPVLVLMTLVAPVLEAQSSDLFTAVDKPPPQSLPADTLTLRSRVVSMDLGQVQRARTAVVQSPRDTSERTDTPRSVPAPGTTLTFNLFDDVVVTGLVERTEPTFSGGYAVSGHLVDEPLGTLTLVVNGATVAGTVRTLDGTYHIRSVGDGLYAISEVEEPPLNCGVGEPHAETDHQH